MNFFNQINTALLGPTASAPPSALDTIHKLTDRLTQSTLLSDRRAAVLSLKGLSRDWKAAVGENSLQALLAVLHIDAKEDSDIGKAVLETLVVLCEVPEHDETQASKGKSKAQKEELALKHTDIVLASPEATHTLLYLFTQTNFYVRFTSVQLLALLLKNRPQHVQQHFLTDPDGPSSILAVITEKREIIRNEALLLTQSLIESNINIQKALAFEGIFETLLGIISAEGGIEGGIVAHDCLAIIDGLLQYNPSNQSYFRELSLPPVLPTLLLYPSPLPPADQPTPPEFTLQFWDQQKLANAGYVVAIIGALSKSKGTSQKLLEQSGISRCLIELALSSNAPIALKTQALRALTPNANFGQPLTPYIPVPDTNGEEWDRLPEEPALSSLIGIALYGEFNGVVGALSSVPRLAEALELRAAAVSLFENIVSTNLDLRLSLLDGMVIQSGSTPDESSASLRLLRALAENPTSPITPQTSLHTLFASQLFTSLIRSSDKAKTAAHAIIPSYLLYPPPPASEKVEEEDEDPPQGLIASLMGNVAIALRARTQVKDELVNAAAATAGGGHVPPPPPASVPSSAPPSAGGPSSPPVQQQQESVSSEEPANELTEWDRIIVSWLTLICTWCWDDPRGVREVLDEGGALGIFAEPIVQTAEVDPLVQGLAAFLLGVCYEFNREPGEITRAMIYDLVHARIGVDTVVTRIGRVKEDARFKAVSADDIVLFFDAEGYEVSGDEPGARATVWLDWNFVEMWRSGSYSIQRSIHMDPEAVAAPRDVDPQTAALIASLKDLIRTQAHDLEVTHEQLGSTSKELETAQEQLLTHASDLERLGTQAQNLGAAQEHIERQARELDEAREKIERLEAELLKVQQTPPEPSPTADSTASIQIGQLTERLDGLEADLAAERAKRKDVEKEQEDLLVLLDELNEKRRKDKERMKEKGMEVSEGEDEDDEEEDEEDEE